MDGGKRGRRPKKTPPREKREEERRKGVREKKWEARKSNSGEAKKQKRGNLQQQQRGEGAGLSPGGGGKKKNVKSVEGRGPARRRRGHGQAKRKGKGRANLFKEIGEGSSDPAWREGKTNGEKREAAYCLWLKGESGLSYLSAPHTCEAVNEVKETPWPTFKKKRRIVHELELVADFPGEKRRIPRGGKEKIRAPGGGNKIVSVVAGEGDSRFVVKAGETVTSGGKRGRTTKKGRPATEEGRALD